MALMLNTLLPYVNLHLANLYFFYKKRCRVNFNQKSEEEMDFIPIIPLNETDAEANEKIDVPSELALLPLRNTVLFPGVVLPITVGRDKSIKAVTDAYKGTKLIGVIAQKDSTIEDPVA